MKVIKALAMTLIALVGSGVKSTKLADGFSVPAHSAVHVDEGT